MPVGCFASIEAGCAAMLGITGVLLAARRSHATQPRDAVMQRYPLPATHYPLPATARYLLPATARYPPY